MSEPAHTPGPWAVEDGWQVVHADNGTKGVADCHRASRSPSFREPIPDDERDANARLIAAAPDLLAALKESDWHSPHETPGFCGSTATTVLVKTELIDNPPEMNAPPHYTFGHRIVSDGNPYHPADGWFFDRQEKGYRVIAWRYIEPPESARAALAAAEPQP